MSSVRGPGRPAPNTGLTSDVLLEAALKAFATYGYDGTSIRTLSRELHISHNLLNQRFGTKDSLWRAALDWGVEHQRRVVAQADDEQREPIDRFRTFIYSSIRYGLDHPELFRLIYLEGGLPSDRLDYITEKYVAPTTSRLSATLEALARLGVIKPVSRALFYSTITFGATSVSALRPMTQATLPDRLYSAEWKDQYADEFTEFILAGLKP